LVNAKAPGAEAFADVFYVWKTKVLFEKRQTIYKVNQNVAPDGAYQLLFACCCYQNVASLMLKPCRGDILVKPVSNPN
jgi:hypothetical protein